MRFAILLAALFGIMALSAQGVSDTALMDYGVEQPRSRIVAYNDLSGAQEGEPKSSKYINLLDSWEQSSLGSFDFESSFTFPFMWVGRQIVVRLDRVSHPYTMRINGVEVARVQNSTLPAEVNITKYAREGRNIITLTLDTASPTSAVESWDRSDSLTIGEGWVLSQPTQMIRDIAIRSQVEGDKIRSQIFVTVKSHALNERTSTIHYSLHSADGGLVTFGHRDITLSMRGEQSFSFSASMAKEGAWSAASPQLYTLRLRTQHEGRNVEYHSYEVGFREVAVDPQSGVMSINAEPTQLRVKSVSKELTKSEIEELKSQGFNAIRLGAGAYSRNMYEECDRVGLYVISPMPINSSAASAEITRGGNPTNDPEWQGAYLQRVETGYHIAQLHPSVIAFSLADSSLNGYNLYEGFLRLKDKGDSRPIIYFESGGEWNTDNVDLQLDKL